jgi:hypothetical protein
MASSDGDYCRFRSLMCLPIARRIAVGRSRPWFVAGGLFIYTIIKTQGSLNLICEKTL